MDDFAGKHAAVSAGDSGKKSQARFPQLCAAGWLGAKGKRPEPDERYARSHDQSPPPWGLWSEIPQHHRPNHDEQRRCQQVFHPDFKQARAQPQQDREYIDGKVAHLQYL